MQNNADLDFIISDEDDAFKNINKIKNYESLVYFGIWENLTHKRRNYINEGEIIMAALTTLFPVFLCWH